VAVVAVVAAFRRRRVLLGALGPAAAVLALAGGISGLLLVWDQLALTRVTTGVNIAGYTWLFDGTGIRYVLVDRSAISTAEFLSWFLAHTVGLPLALLSVGVVMGRATRRGPSAEGG
jgi:quinol-cytochrome oxidoreductase complex cytochrome b subunit